MIKIKRVYEPADIEDGVRVLVDYLWPRGIKKIDLPLKGWYRSIAPSNGLRVWFGHDPNKWNEFRMRYFTELDNKDDELEPLLEAARAGDLTLLYSARDRKYNNAVALKEYLETKLN